MIEKTKDYGKFKFRLDNRDEIRDADVEKIKNSIQSRNLLHLKPIDVNEDFEIIDGQHRLLAAQRLDVDIYYRVCEELKPCDIITLNVSKNWGNRDYLNYYCKNGYQEYIKLNEFIKKNKLELKVAIRLIMGKSKFRTNAFRKGEFKFLVAEASSQVLEYCNETIDYIFKKRGFLEFTRSIKFWMALASVFSNDNFKFSKWMENLSKMVNRVDPRVSEKEYQKMILNIYNYRNNEKILLNFNDDMDE